MPNDVSFQNLLRVNAVVAFDVGLTCYVFDELVRVLNAPIRLTERTHLYVFVKFRVVYEEIASRPPLTREHHYFINKVNFAREGSIPFEQFSDQISYQGHVFRF